MLYYSQELERYVMAIKEPVFHYRHYRVMGPVEYIPCLPVNDGGFPATRIPKGSDLIFTRKIDNELYEVEFEDSDNAQLGKRKAMIMDVAFDWLLPIFRRN